jgi:hypothetical protein
LISGLGSRRDFTGSSFWENSKAFIELEQRTGLKFQGVRFPYRSSNYAGLTYAAENGYIYDTSVGIDHLSGYAGCVFPYNIPLARDSFYKSTDMLELCQILGNDFDYFQIPDSLSDYTEDMQMENATLYSKYLLDFYEYVAKKNDGMMIFTGNPDYTGLSELTMQSLKNLTDELKKNNAWITTPAKIVEYRKSFKTLFVQSSRDGNNITLRFNCPEGLSIEGISLKLGKRPSKVSASCNYEIKESQGRYYIVADVRNGDEIAISN